MATVPFPHYPVFWKGRVMNSTAEWRGWLVIIQWYTSRVLRTRHGDSARKDLTEISEECENVQINSISYYYCIVSALTLYICHVLCLCIFQSNIKTGLCRIMTDEIIWGNDEVGHLGAALLTGRVGGRLVVVLGILAGGGTSFLLDCVCLCDSWVPLKTQRLLLKFP